MEYLSNAIWCLYIIAFSRLFEEQERGSFWRYVCGAFVVIGMVILIF